VTGSIVRTAAARLVAPRTTSVRPGAGGSPKARWTAASRSAASTTITRRSSAASAMARFTAVAVLPSPGSLLGRTPGPRRRPGARKDVRLGGARRACRGIEEQRAPELHAAEQVRGLLPAAKRVVQLASVCGGLVELDRLACDLVESAERCFGAAELVPQARLG